MVTGIVPSTPRCGPFFLSCIGFSIPTAIISSSSRFSSNVAQKEGRLGAWVYFCFRGFPCVDMSSNAKRTLTPISSSVASVKACQGKFALCQWVKINAVSRHISLSNSIILSAYVRAYRIPRTHDTLYVRVTTKTAETAY